MTTKTEYSARFWDEQLGMFRERRPREVFDPLTGEVRRVAEPRLEVSSPVETSSTRGVEPRVFSALEEQLAPPAEATREVSLEAPEEREVQLELGLFDFVDDLSEDASGEEESLLALEDAFSLGEEEEASAREVALARDVSTEGKRARASALRRFLDDRLAAWTFGRGELERLVPLMWESGNWTATFDAFERAFERDLDTPDLEWAHEVRRHCEDRLGYMPCWKWLFDMREHVDSMLGVEEAVMFLEMAREAFVEDYPRMRGWYSFELEPVDRDESNARFYLYLEALLAQMQPCCDPVHAMEALLALEREDHHTAFEHHTRRDHCALDTNATYFHALF